MTFLSKRSGRSRRWFGVMFVFAFAAASFGATPLFAHEKGVLTLNTRQAAPGDTLIARGSKLAKDASFRIEVRGVLRTFPYGRVRTDSTGKFEMRVPLPTDANPGSYLVVAIAADGDVSAQENLVVQPGHIVLGASMPNMPAIGAMAGMDMRATAAPADIRVVTTKKELIVIFAVVVLAILGGFILLRGAATGAPRSL